MYHAYSNLQANLQRQKDETKAATACLLTALDQAKMMDHRKQLLELQQEKEEKEELAHKIKQYEAYIQQLLADNEVNSRKEKFIIIIEYNYCEGLKLFKRCQYKFQCFSQL